MAEIKSTLDLVMEKTKNLSFSVEEKQNNKDVDIHRKIKGIVSKYQDNTLRYSEFEKEIRNLEKQHGTDYKAVVAQEVLQRIEFMTDNSPLIEILKDFCGMQSESITTTINAYREKALQEADQRRHAVLGSLKKEQHISGTAVTANLEKDESLKATLKALQLEFKNRMTSQENFPSA